MKKMLPLGRFFLVGSLLSLSAGNLYGNACSSPTVVRGTTVFFVNGIKTDNFKAIMHTKALEGAYKDTFDNPDFHTAYNNTESFRADLREVYEQKMIESGVPVATANQVLQLKEWLESSFSLEAIQRMVMSGIRASSFQDNEFTQKILQLDADGWESIQDSVLGSDDVVAQIAQALQLNVISAGLTATEDQHIGYYKSALQNGKRVILVAHSQGNLFANATVQSIMNDQGFSRASPSIAVIGVASPAARNLGSNKHITAKDDGVIDLLRLITGNVLPGNIDNDPGLFDFREWTNHSFKKSYFDDRLASRKEIDSQMSSLKDSLPFPPQVAGSGAIRASLTWGDQPDVDLHVFEPDGSHVYYGNKAGTTGTLDVDDVTAYGPENYFVACEDIALGIYRIGVNYFVGFEPETATVVVTLGDGRALSPRSVTLEIGIGASGNDNPHILYRILVERGDTDNSILYESLPL